MLVASPRSASTASWLGRLDMDWLSFHHSLSAVQPWYSLWGRGVCARNCSVLGGYMHVINFCGNLFIPIQMLQYHVVCGASVECHFSAVSCLSEGTAFWIVLASVHFASVLRCLLGCQVLLVVCLIGSCCGGYCTVPASAGMLLRRAGLGSVVVELPAYTLFVSFWMLCMGLHAYAS